MVKAGDYVMIQPQHVMTHDNTGPSFQSVHLLFWLSLYCIVIIFWDRFKSIGRHGYRIHTTCLYTLDHDVQNKSVEDLAEIRLY